MSGKQQAVMDRTEEDKSSDINALEQKLSLLIINSEESYILVDTEFNIVAFNRQFKNQYLQYFGTEIQKGESILKLARPERVNTLKKVYERVFAGMSETTEIEIPIANNDKLIILNRFKPAFDENGLIIGAFVTSSDISALRKAEKDKQEAEKQIEFEHNNLRALINNTKSLIWSYNIDNRLITFNEPFKQHYYKSQGKYPEVGELFIEYAFGTDQKERFSLYTKRVLNGESFSVIEHRYEPNEKWTEISFNPIFDRNQVIGVACVASDVTDRKLFEKNLIQSQNRLKQAQEIAHLGNWELNFATKSAKWSDEAYRIYGITSYNFDHTFESWLSFVHPEDLVHVNEIIKKGYETLKDYSMYHRIIRPDGSIRHLYSESHFEFDMTGKPIGLYGISQDITDRKTNEIKLQELLKRSNEQNKWLNNFTHIVSHNIRSHNSNISGIIELLEHTDDSDEFENLLQMLKHSTTKLSETITNLSEYVTFQNDTEKHYRKVNLYEEIEKTLKVVNFTGSEAKIINEVDKNVELMLIPSYIESILLNLLTNAIKYRSKDRASEIRFRSEKMNGFMCLKVSDNGIGIDLSKHNDSIFGLFKTFHNNKDSIGFGLFITKNQIEAMDGKIEIESDLGTGTTFTIYFHEKS